MADTKQATAETVLCECGNAICKLRDGTYIHIGGINAGNLWCPQWPLQAAKPRTQPSQTELRIPDDLKKRYEYCMDTKGLYDFPNGLVAELIARIARLEGR